MSCFTEAVRLDPKCAGGYCGRGLCQRDSDKRIADLSEAIRLKPGYAEAYCRRGMAYLSKGGYDKATADDIGVAASARVLYAKAIADLSEAIQFKPGYAEAYSGRGTAYRYMSEYDKAILDCTEAIRLDPTSLQPYFDRGVAYQRRGENIKAQADFAEGKRLLELLEKQ
jgi:tetratricopeptide (TPR) repeat protein